jgi:two-component system response regulator PilR (NtrC family)
MLQPLPVIFDHAESLQQAHARLGQEKYDAILTEASLPDGQWLDVLHLARSVRHELEVLVTCRLADARLWTEALSLGAYDLLTQPFDEAEVRRIVSNACTRPAARAMAATGGR